MKGRSRVVISLGSNLEPRAEYLRKAVTRLAALPETRMSSSPLRRTSQAISSLTPFIAFTNAVTSSRSSYFAGER